MMPKKNQLSGSHQKIWSLKETVTLSPNHQQWCAKMEDQLEYVHVAYTFLHVLGTDFYAQSVLIDKNFCIGTQSKVY